MIKIKEYFCECPPTYEEIKQAECICDMEHCIAHLNWFVDFSGWHDIWIRKGDDVDKIYKDISNIVYSI